MSYQKKAKSQYSRKIRAWVLGYHRKGKFHIFKDYVPKSAESIDLVVPLPQENLEIPLGWHAERVRDRLSVNVPREDAEALKKFEVEGLDVEEFLRPPAPRRSTPRVVSEYDRQIATIRKALKKLCPTLSVRRGRGTAYGWIEISGSKEFGNFTEQEKRALDKFGLNYGSNFSVISPEDRKYYVEKAQKLLEV
jgi:hypothetical protein